MNIADLQRNTLTTCLAVIVIARLTPPTHLTFRRLPIRWNADPSRENTLMIQALDVRHSEFYGWLGLILASALLFWFSRGTLLHPFSVGFLTAALVLFVAITLFECLWHATCQVLKNIGVEIKD